MQEKIKGAVVNLFEEFNNEEEYSRLILLNEWRRNEEYYRGRQFLYWSDADQLFRSPPPEVSERLPKVINIYKGHGESVIAAMSAGLPYVQFVPEDADNSDDVETAKVWSYSAELLQKQNEGALLFVKTLYTLWNQSFVAAYNYSVETDETIKIPKYDGNGEHQGYDAVKKAKEKIDIYGSLYVKIPLLARKQDECGYLIFSTEEHYARIRDAFPEIAEQIQGGVDLGDEARRSRVYREYRYEDNQFLTVHRIWLRPWMFEALNNDVELIAHMKKEFPRGLKATLIEQGTKPLIAEVKAESMDDHWTILERGDSLYLHAQPIGNSLIPIQDMVNLLVNLTLETIEHGVPITFASPDTLDFTKFGQVEIKPGDIFPGDIIPGANNMGAGFHSLQTTTLSKEVEPFGAKLEQFAQFVIGSFPSIYGGPSEAGSKTFGEYVTSRNQALQRLGLYWKFVNLWWAQVMNRAVRSFTKNMLEDEKFTTKQDGSFVTTWIRRSSLTGKVGDVLAETAETFPMSFSQKQDTLFKLLSLGIPEIVQALFSPENLSFVSEYLGLQRLKIPGYTQRLKQLEEIGQLLLSEPVPSPDGQLQPSIMPDPDLDIDDIHVLVVQDFLNSRGSVLQETNPNGYQNVKAHLSAHIANVQQKMQQEALQAAQAEGPAPKQAAPPK